MICDSTATDDDATEDEEEKEIAGVRCQSHEEEEESVAKRWGKQHSPLEHLYSKDTSIQGTQNWVPKKCSHNLCILYLYCSDTSIQGKGTLFLGHKSWLYLPFRGHLRNQSVTGHKNCQYVCVHQSQWREHSKHELTHLNPCMCSAFVGIQHTISQTMYII